MYLIVYKILLFFKQKLHPKSLLVMKLTSILLIVFCFCAKANGFSQKISLSEKEVAIEKIFKKITKQSGYTFVYAESVLQKTKKVSIVVRNASVEEALKLCFSDQPITYSIIDKIVVIKEIEQQRQFNLLVLEKVKAIDVQGSILNEKGEPLVGATIVEKGTKHGTASDNAGNFSISLQEGAIMVISYVGYDKKEIKVTNSGVYKISLVPSVSLTDEIVVVGYGTQRKSDLTGSVSSIKVKDLASVPNSRVDQLLQGRSAGVQVTSTSGAPGAGTAIRVRGGNSIVGDNEPLWVIDGIIVGQNFDLNNINSNDIKSIEILKDASSIAIYGSRGANGVVLVTTKSGKKTGGKPEINVGFSAGTQNITKHPAYMTGPQHIEYANEDAKIRGVAAPFPNPSIVPNTDWKGLLLKPASMLNTDVSLNGSSADGKVNYYSSVNYFKQDGVIKGSGMDKFVFRSNVDITLSKKVNVGFRINVARTDQELAKASYQQIITQLPERGVKDANGNYTGIDPITGSVSPNLVANTEQNLNNIITNNLLGSAFLEYKPSKKWLIRTSFNPEINGVNQNIFNSSQSPDYIAVGDKGSATVKTLSATGWNNENTVQYSTQIQQNHSVTVLGGFSTQKYSAESSSMSVFGINSDATTFHNLSLGSDPSRNVISSGYDAFQTVSYFGRLNYSYKSKYLLTLVGRSDGASRFAPGNKYAFFPSIAGAWKLSEEKFIQRLNIFDVLKLRASYGRAGSQAIESFRTLAIMENANTSYNGVLTAGTTLGRPANEKLKWETTEQLDLGLEASFLKGRISAELDYYDKKTSDLLLDALVPQTTGFLSQLKNLGKIRNHGLEFMLNTINISKKNFSWSSTFNISSNRNEVVDLGGVQFINLLILSNTDNIGGIGGRLQLGQPANVFMGVKYLGTWKNQAEITASKQLTQIIGGPRFDDPNGDGQILSTEYYSLGSPQADFIYGFQNSFRFKKFDLSVYIQGTKGNEVFNSLSASGLFVRGEQQKYAEKVNRWTPTNTTSDIPAAGYIGGVSTSSAVVEDGSHLRFKTVRLAYTFSLPKWHNNINLYVVANNLFLFSNFRLIDPETSQIGKSDANGNVMQGYAKGEYPSPRTISVGFTTTF